MTETVDCANCGEAIPREEAHEEFNKHGPGPDTRYYCGLVCASEFAEDNL